MCVIGRSRIGSGPRTQRIQATHRRLERRRRRHVTRDATASPVPINPGTSGEITSATSPITQPERRLHVFGIESNLT